VARLGAEVGMMADRPEAQKRLKAKNAALGAVLAGLVVLFYLLGMFRFGGGTP
jgi:hypothetical protein